MLTDLVQRYQNRSIEAAQVMEELVQMAKKFREAAARGEQLGLTEDEVRFYDALANNESAVRELTDETLKKIAHKKQNQGGAIVICSFPLWGKAGMGGCARRQTAVNYVRTDPPLLWRRCDAAVVAALSIASIVGFVFLAWPALLVGAPMALLYAPLIVTARLAWRCRTRTQVDRALKMERSLEVAQPFLRRVK